MPSNASDYMRAHKDVWAALGKASERTCPCGEQARDWAYQGDAPEKFSSDPNDYKAMCRGCHVRLDGTVGLTLKNLTPDQRRPGGLVCGNMKRTCECGLVCNPGGMGTHQRATGHNDFQSED